MRPEKTHESLHNPHGGNDQPSGGPGGWELSSDPRGPWAAGPDPQGLSKAEQGKSQGALSARCRREPEPQEDLRLGQGGCRKGKRQPDDRFGLSFGDWRRRWHGAPHRGLRSHLLVGPGGAGRRDRQHPRHHRGVGTVMIADEIR